MINNIPTELKQRMEYLSQVHEKDEIQNVPRQKRLRQITSDTGEFLALMVCNCPDGNIIEIGTSGGYSALWLSLGCMEIGRQLFTFENDEEKIAIARETIRCARVENIVNIVSGDALLTLETFDNIAFCFIDADKPIYSALYESVIPKMVKGGLLIVDNIISHYQVLSEFCKKVLDDPRVDAMVIPVGQGELYCRVK